MEAVIQNDDIKRDICFFSAFGLRERGEGFIAHKSVQAAQMIDLPSMDGKGVVLSEFLQNVV